MRKIELEMIEAIKAGKNWRKDNTEVLVDQVIDIDNQPTTVIRLHNRIIARINKSDVLLSDQGYITKLTFSRLNAILQYFRPTYRLCTMQRIMCVVECVGDDINPRLIRRWEGQYRFSFNSQPVVRFDMYAPTEASFKF